VEISERRLKDWKEALAKSGVVYETDEEYKEALHNLTGYFDILIQMDLAKKAK
jgi:hypothetical protein